MPALPIQDTGQQPTVNSHSTDHIRVVAGSIYGFIIITGNRNLEVVEDLLELGNIFSLEEESPTVKQGCNLELPFDVPFGLVLLVSDLFDELGVLL